MWQESTLVLFKKEELFLKLPRHFHNLLEYYRWLRIQAKSDYVDVFPTTSTRLGANYLTILCLILGCAMCMSNICAVKIWQIGPLILDGGFLLFPITYVVTDILVEIFYRKYANRVIFWCCLANVGCFLALQLTKYLPAAPGASQVDIASSLGLSSRIFIASVIATIVSSRVNNLIYDWLRPYTKSLPGTSLRAWASSFVAHIPDSALFTVLAFAGLQSTAQGLFQQAVTSYLSAFAVETLFIPITTIVAVYLKVQIRQAQYT